MLVRPYLIILKLESYYGLLCFVIIFLVFLEDRSGHFQPPPPKVCQNQSCHWSNLNTITFELQRIRLCSRSPRSWCRFECLNLMGRTLSRWSQVPQGAIYSSWCLVEIKLLIRLFCIHLSRFDSKDWWWRSESKLGGAHAFGERQQPNLSCLWYWQTAPKIAGIREPRCQVLFR